MTPLRVLKTNPEGNAGAMEYDVAAPPELNGLFGGIVLPRMYTAGLAEYVRLDGACAQLLAEPKSTTAARTRDEKSENAR
jgi:hypothetical protein